MYSLKNSIFFISSQKYMFLFYVSCLETYWAYFIFFWIFNHIDIFPEARNNFASLFVMIFTSFVIEKYALSNIILHQQETEYFYLPKNFLIRSNCYLMKYFLWNELMNILIEILHRKNLLIFRTFPHRIGMLSISSGKTNPKWFSMKIKWKRGDHVVQY